MSTPYSGDPDNTPTTIPVVDDGDNPSAALIGAAADEACFDWIKHLDRDKAEAAAIEGEALTLQLASAALDWVRPGVSLTTCTALAGAWCPVSDTGGNGAFFAVDGGTGFPSSAAENIYKSHDGQAWSVDDNLSGLSPDGGIFALAASTIADVLVGIADGGSETDSFSRVSGTWSKNTVMVATHLYSAIAYSEADDHFVAVGSSGGAFVASITFNNGTSWDDGHEVASAFDPPSMLAINSAGVCVAMSNASGNYFRSTNGGVSWAEVASGVPFDPRALACDQYTGRFWVIGDAGEVRSSADGLTWTAHTACPVVPGGTLGTSLAVHRGVLVVASGASFQTRVSVNGGAWSKVAGATVANPSFVRYGGGRFWMAGAGSANGTASSSRAAMLIGGF